MGSRAPTSLVRPSSLAAVSLIALLGGCTHNLYLAGRSTPVTGGGSIVTAGNKSGDITLTLGSKTYTGRWVYVMHGGGIGVGTATAFAGGNIATVTGTATSLPTGGGGTILATAPDGSTLRCVFDYSEWGGTGVGVCQDSAGELYDLQIS